MFGIALPPAISLSHRCALHRRTTPTQCVVVRIGFLSLCLLLKQQCFTLLLLRKTSHGFLIQECLLLRPHRLFQLSSAFLSCFTFLLSSTLRCLFVLYPSLAFGQRFR